MAKISNFELVADRDVKAGEKITLASLFSIPERSKEHPLLEDVKEGTRLQVSITKVKPLLSSADANAKKGDRVTSWRLIKYPDFVGEIAASDSIRAGEKLSVTYDTVE
ncbi:MAG: hypothetical protein HYX90_12375 [Chloroflexi bacterium]|nr:hypothetical protein [Chloroflexota bacterium]